MMSRQLVSAGKVEGGVPRRGWQAKMPTELEEAELSGSLCWRSTDNLDDDGCEGR